MTSEQERADWISKQIKLYKVDKVGKLLHAHNLYIDAVESYIKGLPYASILCTEAALNSLLCQKLQKKPELTQQAKKKEKLKPYDYRMPATSQLIKEAKFISNDLKREITSFINIRHKVEHPKTQMELIFINWSYDGESRQRFDDNQPVSDLFCLDNLPQAQMGLIVYFKVCKAIFNWITKD